jgi:hypothetical protein
MISVGDMRIDQVRIKFDQIAGMMKVFSVIFGGSHAGDAKPLFIQVA